ncbi:MAG TPA: BCAM0308 family protein [Gammaproteobacteria bacterium]
MRELEHDPYRAGEKLSESVRCPDCGVQYHDGRWVWPKTEAPELKVQPCPACRRIADGYPAGELVLTGSFLSENREQVLATATHFEGSQRDEHPLNRIIAIEDRDSEIVVTTTDVHLPHGIAHALKDAWGGEMKTHYDEEGYFTRVHWERND